MKKILLGVAMTSTLLLLGACDGESAEEKKTLKALAEAEELKAELNQKLAEIEEESKVKPESEEVDEQVSTGTSDEDEVLESEEGMQLEWDGETIELPQNLEEQTFEEDSSGIRWYENGSPVEHDLFTYNISRIDINKRMASDLSTYELLPAEGHTQIIVELLVEHTGNRASTKLISPKLYTLKDGWEQLDEYRIDQDFNPKLGLNKTYYEIIGTAMNGQPRQTDRGDRFVTHLIYEVPNELLSSDKEWVLFQTDKVIGYSATPYSRHLGKLK